MTKCEGKMAQFPAFSRICRKFLFTLIMCFYQWERSLPWEEHHAGLVIFCMYKMSTTHHAGIIFLADMLLMDLMQNYPKLFKIINFKGAGGPMFKMTISEFEPHSRFHS